MRYLPIELDVAGREALVVGSSDEALGKVRRLLDAGARVTLLACRADDARLEPIRAAAGRDGTLVVDGRAPVDADLERAFVTFVVPGDDALVERAHRWAVDHGRLLCVLDRPERSVFVNPAVVDAGGLVMAFSSGGASPGTLRRLREDLEAAFSDPRLARWLATMRRMREALPRGERASRVAAAVRGFGVDARLRFPDWFERDESPPLD